MLEYNARFGDPETQVVLPRMKSDILDIMEACVEGRLDKAELVFDDNAAVCVVLASDGYPLDYEKGKEVTIKEGFGKDGLYLYHAGTKLQNGQRLFTSRRQGFWSNCYGKRPKRSKRQGI